MHSWRRHVGGPTSRRRRRRSVYRRNWRQHRQHFLTDRLTSACTPNLILDHTPCIHTSRTATDLIRDESISGIPMGPVGIPWAWEVLTLVPWEWERARELLDGNARELNHYIFPFPTHSNRPTWYAYCWTKIGIGEKWPNFHICRPLFWIWFSVVLTLWVCMLFVSWYPCKTATGAMRYYSMGVIAGGNNRWEWEGNWNKTWIGLGAKTEWEWTTGTRGSGLEKDIPAHL